LATALPPSSRARLWPRFCPDRWARAIYAAYPDAEGLWYDSSMHANTGCVALLERAEDALPPRPQIHRALADMTLRALVRNAAAGLNFRLIT
jgi:hypothetical protein